MPSAVFIITIIYLAITPALRAESITHQRLNGILGDQVKWDKKDEQELIRIEVKKDSKPQDIFLFDLKHINIRKKAYAVAGEVRYEKVAGKSYLETWNHFISDQGPSNFFTRGLDSTGPMGVLNGNSDWRAFRLPFFINTDDKSIRGPIKIKFNLHMEGGGLVEIRNVYLVDGLKAPIKTPTETPYEFYEAARKKLLPKPWEIALIVMLSMIIPVIVITIVVVSLRRKKRTAEELRRIRAADV